MNDMDENIRGSNCRSVLDEIASCRLNELKKEAEKLHKKIMQGKKGSPLEPRDYPDELRLNQWQRENILKVHEYLKKKCPE